MITALVATLREVSFRKAAMSVAFSAVFTVVDSAAQLATGLDGLPREFSVLRSVIALIGSGMAVWLFLSLVDLVPQVGSKERPPQERILVSDPTHRSRIASRRVPIVTFAATLVSWGVLFFHFWPMVAMNDTAWILDDPIGASIQHPLAYNLALSTVVRTGTALGGSMTTGVVLAGIGQMLLWSATLAFLAAFLQDRGVPERLLWVFVAYCALSPLVANYSFALVKDAAFSMFVVCLFPILLILQGSGGRTLVDSVFFVVAATALVGFAVTRNNGLAALVVLVPLLLVFSSRHWRRALILVLLTLSLSLLPSQVSRQMAGAHKFVETVGVPLQMVGYAIAHDRECLDPVDQRYFSSIMPLSDWAQTYVPTSVDPVKDSPHFNAGILGADRSAFAGHWLSGARSCRAAYTRGYVSQTANLWRIDAMRTGETGQSVFTSVVTNHPAHRQEIISDYADQGVVNRSLLPVRVDHVVGALFDAGVMWTPGAGTWFWMMLLTIWGFIYGHRWEWLAALSPSIVVWLTLLAGAPTPFPLRYVQFVVVTVPATLLLLFGVRSPVRCKGAGSSNAGHTGLN